MINTNQITLDKRIKQQLNSEQWHEQIWENSCHFDSYAVDAVAQLCLFKKAREYIRDGISVEKLREDYNLLPVISPKQLKAIERLQEMCIQKAKNLRAKLEKEYYTKNPDSRGFSLPFEVSSKINELVYEIRDDDHKTINEINPYFYNSPVKRESSGEGICRMFELEKLSQKEGLFVPKTRLVNRPYVTILDCDDLNSTGAYTGRLYQLCGEATSEEIRKKLKGYSPSGFNYDMAYQPLNLSDFANPDFLDKAELMEKTIFKSECRSWYIIKTGKFPPKWNRPLDLSDLDNPTARLIEYYTVIVDGPNHF